MAHDGHELSTALAAALAASLEILRRHERHEETYDAINAAIALAELDNPTPEKVEELGAGWVAEEALAIAIYAALCHPDDPRAALLLAANHSGDSDSTGAICGNLIGARHGVEALPQDWLDALEGRETISQVADDLVAEDLDTEPRADEAGYEDWWRKYPGW